MREDEDYMRDAAWWLSAYQFLLKFEGYELVRGFFCEGMVERHCLKYEGQWLGPEIHISNVSKELAICSDLYRALTL